MQLIPSQDVKEGKSLALLSHLPIFGVLIAWVLNLKKNNIFAGFYIRQMIGWNLLWILNKIIFVKLLDISFLKWILIIFLIISVLNVISEKEKPLPFIGEKIQELFRKL